MAKLRSAVLAMTDSGRVLESVNALLPGLERAPALAVAAEVSAKLRAVLLPLVK